MKVILLDNIKGIGQIGDVKNVTDGYGRNFLIPRKLAKLGTPSAMKDAEVLRQKLSTMIEVQKKNTEDVAEKLNDMTVEIIRKASETGTLFDGIDKIDIVEAMRSKTQIELSKDMIILYEKIKKVGEHTVNLQLMPEIKAQIKVLVVAE